MTIEPCESSQISFYPSGILQKFLSRLARSCQEFILLSSFEEFSFKMFSFLSFEKFSEKKFFFPILKFGWRFIGFWPGSDSTTKLQLTVAVLNAIEVLIYCFFQLNFCILNRQKLVVLLDALTPFGTQFVSVIKILIIVRWRKEIKQILDYLKNSFENGELLSVSSLILLIRLLSMNFG
jgi:hypothetical protein